MIVYVLKDGECSKIGITSDWNKREQAYHTHNPRFTLRAVREVDEDTARRIEKSVRSFFQDCRSSVSREWFTTPADYMTAIVDGLLAPVTSAVRDNLVRHAVPVSDEGRRLLRVDYNERNHDWYSRYNKEFAKSFGLGLTSGALPDTTAVLWRKRHKLKYRTGARSCRKGLGMITSPEIASLIEGAKCIESHERQPTQRKRLRSAQAHGISPPSGDSLRLSFFSLAARR